MKHVLLRLLTLSFIASSIHAQNRFAYDTTKAAAVRTIASRTEGAARVDEISYGDTPATLVLPARSAGRAPAVIFMHWGLGDRHSFLDEAGLLARYGVASLLIDAPFARASYPPEEWKQITLSVIDVRRGIDLLQSRSDIDGARIGFAGLSYGAHVGGVLAGIEPRLRALVLAGGLASNSTEMEKPSEDDRALDAEKWIGKRTSPVFLQFAEADEYIPRKQADRYAEAAGGTSLTKFYEGGHELVAVSRHDRLQWLSGHLGFTIDDPTYHPVAALPSPGFAGTQYAELSKLGVVLEIPGMQSIPVRRDLVWKTVDGKPLRMDIYYPFGMEQEPALRVPAIILVSGQAAPEVMPKLRGIRFVTTAAQAIASRANRAVVVYDIRSVLKEPVVGDEQKGLPEVTQDLDDLIAYLRAHGPELRINGDQLAILARSAGGTYGIHAAWAGERPHVKAVALQYVDIDGRTLKGSGLPEAWLPRVIATDLAKEGRKAPLLLVTAQHDFFYDAASVEALKTEAARHGTKIEHIHLAHSDHGFDLVNDTEESRDALRRTILFLREHLPLKRR